MPSVQQRKSRWYAVIWIPETKKRQWIPLPTDIKTKREASEAARQIANRRIRQRERLSVSSTGSIESFLRVAAPWLREIKSQVEQQTYNWYESIVERFARFVGIETPIAKIDAQACRDYVAHLKTKPDEDDPRRVVHGDESVRKICSRLKAIFERAVESGVVATNPWARVRLPAKPAAKPKFLTREDFARLIATAPPHRRLRYSLLAYTGARVSEARRIRWQDINFDRGTIMIGQAQKGAGTKANFRIVPLLDELRAVLEPIRQASGPILTDSDHNWRREALTDARHADLGRPIDLLAFRHTFGSWMAQAGVHVIQLKDLMGHESIETTMIYARFSPDQLDDVRRRFSKLCRHSVDRSGGEGSEGAA